MPVPIIAQWLNLPKVEIIGVRTEEHTAQIALEPTEGPTVCSCWGKEVSRNLDSPIYKAAGPFGLRADHLPGAQLSVGYSVPAGRSR